MTRHALFQVMAVTPFVRYNEMRSHLVGEHMHHDDTLTWTQLNPLPRWI